ncbi:MAG: hypothetical protein KKB24_01935 [Candidatus Altiarchaeota archaeon]|nr:hypothetical protein [Candidatus Altiarchaeota archaeon]
MLASHRLRHREVRKIVDSAGFLLSNKCGGFVHFSDRPRSRYEGLFFRLNGRVYRTIADIGIEGEVKEISNKFYRAERILAGNRETFFMPFGRNSVSYELDSEDQVSIALDVRKIYESGDFGGNYDITCVRGTIVIEFKREGECLYLAIKADGPEYGRIEEWKKVFYPDDEKRNSPPFELYVYDALKLNAKKLVVSFSDKKRDAVREASFVFQNLYELKKKQVRWIEKRLSSINAQKDIKLANNCCLNSLYQLTTEDGIPAGFPWFFQYWSRDELIALNGTDRRMRKKILLRSLKNLREGRLPNILGGAETNADSAGWLFKRIDDDLEIFTKKERELIKRKLLDSIRNLDLSSEPGKTWMDSVARGGKRIEVQALALNMHRLAFRLTGRKKYRKLEDGLRDSTRSRFWNGEILADGEGDFTVRPNIFIAAYVYPELLGREEWIRCLENSLPKLWLEWGGLSSIDKNDGRFRAEHTGENPESYHNGDSWYWLNNLAALVMHRIDAERFGVYIDGILAASTRDILSRGAIGHHSEISSASRETAAGCRVQAWSAALYLELVEELFGW